MSCPKFILIDKKNHQKTNKQAVMQSDDLLYPDIKFGWTMNVYYSNTYCYKKYTNKYIYMTHVY